MTDKIIDITVPNAATIAFENQLFEEKMLEIDVWLVESRQLRAKLNSILQGEPA